MQHAELVPFGDGRDQQVGGWEPVMPGASELALGVQRSLLDCVVDVEPQKRVQLGEEPFMLTGNVRAVAAT